MDPRLDNNVEILKIPCFEGPHRLVLFIIVCLIVSIPIRIVVRAMKIKILQEFLLMTAAICMGIVIHSWHRLAELKEIIHEVDMQMVFHAYLPIFITATIYRMEQYIFIRSMGQVLIIVLFGTCLSTCIQALVMSFLIHDDYSYIEAVIAAAIIVPIQPLRVVLMFKDVFKFRYLSVMLDSESVLMTIPICILYTVLLGTYIGIITSWTQMVAVVLRKVVGGFVMGVIMGSIVSRIIRWLYNEPGNALIHTLGMNYFLYFACEKLLGMSSSLSIVVMNCFITTERPRFTDEVNKALVHFWSMLQYMADIVILMLCTTSLTMVIMDDFHTHDCYLALWLYAIGVSLRIFRFLVLSPLLNLMHYELQWRCILLLGCCDIKGCVNLNLALLVYNHTKSMDLVSKYSMEILVYTFFTTFVNVPLMWLMMRFLGFVEFSKQRKYHMNSCTKYIMSKRIAMINILKMNRFFSLSNWNSVRIDTYLPPPFPKLGLTQYTQMNLLNEDNLDGRTCPRCVFDLPIDTGEDTLDNLLMESERIILKAKKISIIKQYENGMISKYCLVVLVHYFEILLESKREDNELNITQNYLKKHKTLTWLRKVLVRFYEHATHRPSKTQCANVLYYITMHVAYELTLCFITLAYAVVSCVIYDESARNAMYLFHILVTFFFFADFVIKLISFSNVWLIISGILPYFKTKRNIIDFFLVIFMLTNVQVCHVESVFNWFHWYVLPAPRLMALVRCIQIPNILSFLSVYIVKWIDHRIDASLCLDFVLATALMHAADDVLTGLPHLIELKMIRDFHRKQIEEERTSWLQKMEMIRHDRPWIAISVKTNQAISTTLTAMKDFLDDYKTSGFIDNIEHGFIYEQIFKKQKMFRSLNLIQATKPKMLFTEILWMIGENENVVEYLHDNLQLVRWKSNEIVQRHNYYTQGIYIVINGSLKLKYRPYRTSSGSEFGRIPIVDYLNSVDYNQRINDFIVTGHTFGELAVLTGRQYDCIIYAVTASTAYWLPLAVVKEAMKRSHNPISGLEARMWKCCLIHLATAIMLEFPLYQSFSHQEICLKLERSFVPALCGYRVFVVTEMMDDVLLLEGVVEDVTTGESYTAPILLPRKIRRLTWRETLLSRSTGATDMPMPRLLIVPMGDATDVEIMANEAEVAETFSVTSSECFQEKRLLATKKVLNATREQADQLILSKSSESFKNFDWHHQVEITPLEGDNPALHFDFNEGGDFLHSHLTRNRVISSDSSKD